MITSNKTYIIALFLMALNLTVSAQDKAKEIYTKATDQLLVENMQMEMELQITDKRGRVKVKGFEVYMAKFGDTEKTKMSWQKPEEARGTTIILTEPQGETGIIEVFTPSNGKVRKLKATADNMELVGSELSITTMPTDDLNELDFKLLDPQELDGKSCYNIEIKAEKKIAECKALKIPYLDLSHLKLQTIPHSIAELHWLEALSLSNNQLSNIESLAPLTNLHKLAFSHNNITNIDILKEHKKLKFIFMHHNQISCIKVLSTLEKLKKIDAHHNEIKNIDPLSSLTNIVYLDVAHNNIEDIRSIEKLETLIWLSLENNPADKNALNQIPASLKSLAHYVS